MAMSEGLQRRIAEQSRRGEGGFDYDGAIRGATTPAEGARLAEMRDLQLRQREQKRRAAVENGNDESGRIVAGRYAPSPRLTQAAVDEDEFAKMIRSSSPSFYNALRVLERQASTKASEDRSADPAQDDEDVTVYGDLFSREGLHEAEGPVVSEACTVVDLQEGVIAKTATWRSCLFDAFLGGTRFDSSGRAALEQRPLVKGGTSRVFLRRLALRRTPQEFPSLERLVAKGVPDQVLRERGWYQEGHMKDHIKPLGWWNDKNRKEQKARMKAYDKMHERVGAIPASMAGVPAARGKKRKHGNEQNEDDGAAKRRRGSPAVEVAAVKLSLPTAARLVKFAEDA